LAQEVQAVTTEVQPAQAVAVQFSQVLVTGVVELAVSLAAAAQTKH
jgi:hypothetical protein